MILQILWLLLETLGIFFTTREKKMVPWTAVTTDPNLGIAEYTQLQKITQPTFLFKLEAVINTPYVGAPLVTGVYAQQEPGSKNVRIDFSLVLAYDDRSNVMGDKSSFLEFWFKSDPSSPQWEECHMFESAGGGGSPGGNQKQPWCN